MLFGVVVLAAQIVYQVVTDLGTTLDPVRIWNQRDTVLAAVSALFAQWTMGLLELF